MSRTAIFSQIETVTHSQRTVTPQLRTPLALADNRLASISARPTLTRLRNIDLSIANQISFPQVNTKQFNFTIPQGLKYDGATVITLPPTSGGAIVSLENQPSNGVIGNQSLTVKYSIPPGGTIRYRVRTYGRPIVNPSVGNEQPDYELLYASDFQSVERLASLMQSKQRIVLAIQGDEALNLVETGLFKPGEWKLRQNNFGLPVVEMNPAWELVVIVGILATAAIALAVIILIQTMVSEGIKNGYRIVVKEVTLGDLNVFGTTITFSLPTLGFELIPPS